MMIELLGDFPKSVSSTGKFAGDYFNRKVRERITTFLHDDFESLKCEQYTLSILYIILTFFLYYRVS